MKTARERAGDWLIKQIDDGFIDSYDHEDLKSLELLLKEQDKITRHACAEAVQTYAIKDGYDENGILIQTSMAVAECMNVKAV